MNWICTVSRGRLGAVKPSLHGLFIPLVTPFTDEGQLAPGALERLAHSVLDAGAAGLVALGTTAEAAALSAAERRAVLDVCARVSRDRRAPLIAGAGSNDTAGTVRAVAELVGWPEISAALTVVPYYTRPSPAGVTAHFTRVAAASPVPLVVYNVPDRTGTRLSAGTLLELAGIGGIAGVKHAAGGIDADTVTLMADLPSGFAVLAGDDLFASALLALGAAGGILASAHVCPDAFARLIGAWHAGEATAARALGHHLVPLAAALFAEPNPAVIKGVLHAQGAIPSPAVRLPLLPASQDSVRAARRLLSRPLPRG
jgi:4-hydroxy-tetrahydrodipicolinate synthase